jgi:tight adherence protein B
VNELSWLSVGLALISWPVSVRAARLRALADAGRLPRPPGYRWRPPSVAEVMSRTASAERRRHRRRDELHLVLTLLCGELQSGATPADALRSVGDAVPAFRADLEELLAGGETSAELRPVAVGWRIAEQTGAALVEVLDRVRSDVDAERQLQRAVAVAVAGPRATAGLLALLPILGVALGAAIGARPISVLFGSAPGHVLLLVGVVLDAGGVLWTRRLIRRAQPAAPT